ncbi:MULTISPECIES: hypothetical protein [unclassified Microcoleus]
MGSIKSERAIAQHRQIRDRYGGIPRLQHSFGSWKPTLQHRAR